MAIGDLISGLTNRFTNTEFLKTNSELELQIQALKNLLEKYPDNDDLQKELKLCELGLFGEHEIEYELKNSNIGMFVLHDVNLKYQDLKAQIDYIIITPAKTYLVECKNLVGNITIDSNGGFIREYQYGGKKIKEGIYSPVTQAQRHIEIFKKVWMEQNTSFIDKTFRYNNFEKFNVPLVVMANSKNIINDKYAPKDVKKYVIRSDRLIDYLKKDIQEMDKDFLENQKQMQQRAEKILNEYDILIIKNYEKEYIEKFNLQIEENGENTLLQEKEEIKTDNIVNTDNNKDSNEELRNKLIEFRKNKSKEKGIPAYYVFNNEELEGILKIMPKTLEELKNSKVLSDTRLRLHGDEIVRIINEE